MAGLIDCDVNFNVPKDKAVANVKDVEAKEPPVPVDGAVGDCGGLAFLDWRWSCRAFASAFSCVRTKLARF